MDILIVLVAGLIFLGGVFLLVGATYLSMRWLARSNANKMVELDRRLTELEAGSGTCMACEGHRVRWEAVGGRSASAVTKTCWRCDGSGEPPTAEDRRRFMPDIPVDDR